MVTPSDPPPGRGVRDDPTFEPRKDLPHLGDAENPRGISEQLDGAPEPVLALEAVAHAVDPSAPAAGAPAAGATAAPGGGNDGARVARKRQLVLTSIDVGLIPEEGGLFRRAKTPDPVARQQQTRDVLRILEPDMIVLQGIADAAWAAELGRSLLPEFPHIAYRASAQGHPPGGAIAILSRHQFIDTRFSALTPVHAGKPRDPEPGVLLTVQDAGELGRLRIAVMESGRAPKRTGDEPKQVRALRQQVHDIVATVMDPAVDCPTLLLGTPPIWPQREQAAFTAFMTAGLVDGMMAAAPPARQGVYDPTAGGLPVAQRHHLFMRVGDFAHMFLDRIESVEGDMVVNLDKGAWIHLPRHRPLRLTMTPRVR